jgi:hypothetical protein
VAWTTGGIYAANPLAADRQAERTDSLPATLPRRQAANRSIPVMTVSTTAAELPCPDCDAPRLYDHASGLLACEQAHCPAAGLTTPLWFAAEQAAVRAPAPAGTKRPVYGGLPVPWITLITTARVYWKVVDGRRQAESWNSWLCQGCGLPLPDESWIVTEVGGRILDAPLHRSCLDAARRLCPHLSGPRTRSHDRTARREDILANGVPLLDAPPCDPFFLAEWTVAV